LDSTYSFFIASFCTGEASRSPEEEVGNPEYCPDAVWAINKGWLGKHMVRLMKPGGGEIMLCEQWQKPEG
jgi:hypothetical protein